MTISLTDVDAFTSPVVAPADLESANSASLLQGFQPLANRTHHLNQRTLGLGATWGRFSLSGGIAMGIDEKLTIGAATVIGDLTVVGGNEVNFGSAGLYLINYSATLNVMGTSPGIVTGIALDIAGAVYMRSYATVPVAPNDFIAVAAATVASPSAGQRLSLKVTHNPGTFINTDASGLSIVRIK